MSWNPDQYLKFAEPRLRPAIDLLARIECDSPRRVCDLGCGAGNVTQLLRKRWPFAEITGVDDSQSMLDRAAELLPDVNWINCGIGDWRPSELPDIVFSNAALHWLDDHGGLLRTLIGKLASGGELAIQMPRNFAAPSHTTIAEIAREERWRRTLTPLIRPSPVSAPVVYHSLLSSQCSRIDIWETEYMHVLSGVDPVKEWVKGTWLKQFLDALDPSDRPNFESEYARRVKLAYPQQQDGTTLFPFKRIFIVARKR